MNIPTSSTRPAAAGTPSLQQETKALEQFSESNETKNFIRAPAKTGGTLREAMTAADQPTQTPDSIIEERKKVHGDFTHDASVSQELKATLRDGPNWETMSSVQHEALEMIATKLGRITVGDPRHKDHWLDIAGYAMLVAQRL